MRHKSTILFTKLLIFILRLNVSAGYGCMVFFWDEIFWLTEIFEGSFFALKGKLFLCRGCTMANNLCLYLE